MCLEITLPETKCDIIMFSYCNRKTSFSTIEKSQNLRCAFGLVCLLNNDKFGYFSTFGVSVDIDIGTSEFRGILEYLQLA